MGDRANGARRVSGCDALTTCTMASRSTLDGSGFRLELRHLPAGRARSGGLFSAEANESRRKLKILGAQMQVYELHCDPERRRQHWPLSSRLALGPILESCTEVSKTT